MLAGVVGKLDVVRLPSSRFASYYRRSKFSKAQLEQVFTAVATRENPIKVLEVSGYGVTKPSSTIFVSALSNVRELKLECFDDQMQGFLMKIVEHELPLIKLDLNCVILNIDPDLVGHAFNRLEEVMHRCSVTLEQMKSILRGIVEGESKLKRLMLSKLRPVDISVL